MTWTFYRSFDEFTPHHLYDILKLRQDIFIIEQSCIYDDIDGLDEKSHHLLLHYSDGTVIGYLRIVPPAIKFKEYSLGRIVIDKNHRNQGLGRKLIEKGIDTTLALGARDIRIEAQAHLENFYKEIGFTTVSDVYSVDDIPHLQMIVKR